MSRKRVALAEVPGVGCILVRYYKGHGAGGVVGPTPGPAGLLQIVDWLCEILSARAGVFESEN